MSEHPLRILVVSMWPSAAAPERGVFVQRQVDALVKLGHDVAVVPLTDLRSGRLRTPLKYAGLALRAWRAGRRHRPDVVHGHFLVPTGSVARMVARRLGVPYVVTAHGTDVRNAESGTRLRKRTGHVVRDAAAVIAVSEPLAARLRAMFPDLTVHVGDMGVDTSRFAHRRLHDEREQSGAGAGAGTGPSFVAVGSLLPNKNHERLLRALAQLGNGARLACVGEGSERARLVSLAESLGLQRNVAFAGRVPHDELSRWYGNIDAACLVSLDEGFGLAALEALACGCPVVVSKTAPVAEFVKDGVTGSIVDPFDVNDIARGLRVTAGLPRLSADEVVAAVAGRSTVDRARELADLLTGIAIRSADAGV